MSKEIEKVEQPAGLKPMTVEEREKYGLPPLKEEQHDLEAKSNT